MPEFEEGKFRIESDSMGEVKIPAEAYWGAQTQRALNNFKISGVRFSDDFIKNLAAIKKYAAEANMELGLLNNKLGDAIVSAADKICRGEYLDQFQLDVFQTGSGTSTNMNMNEVIANLANEILGYPVGSKHPVHPNDHVNMGQSSNDIIPSCMNITSYLLVKNTLIPSLKILLNALNKKSKEFWEIIKIGRTHLQDALPVRLGQEFGGYAEMIDKGIFRVERAASELLELPLGGTAVGTGVNTHPDFADLVIKKINKEFGTNFKRASSNFEAQGSRDVIVGLSGSLKSVAVSIMKIAEDVRLMASGPRCGIGEIILPEIQPGSSIMPGKVNPVIPEAAIQVAAQVIGNDLAISIGGMRGILELNLMMPMMTRNINESIVILSNVSKIFAENCIIGIKANIERINELVEKSLALITVLVPVIGYDRAAEIAKEAYLKNKNIKDIVLEKGLVSPDKIDEILSPENMV